MQHHEHTLIGAEDVPLVYGTWSATDNPKAAVVVVHGYSEHMGRYSHVIEVLAERGYLVYAIDHRGHGRSGGERVNVEQFSYFIEDLHRLVTQVRESHPDLPLFMLAHSMGGLIAVHYALQYQEVLEGLVLSGPALQIGDDVSPLLKTAGSLLAWLAPSLPIVGGAESRLSRDPDVQRRFDADPLTYKGKAKARMAQELYEASLEAREQVERLTLPLLIMHGTGDLAANPAGSELLYQQAQSTDKTLKLWPECWHELFNELNKDEVIAFVVDWLDERAGGANERVT